MKRYLSVLSLLLFAIGCKKSDDSGTSSNSWKVGSETYTANTVVGTPVGGMYTLGAVNTGGSATNSLVFYFGSTSAPAAGTYKVVSGAGGLPGANQLYFIASSTNGSSSTGYSSTGNDNVTATVTVNGGKLSISLPEAWAKKTGGTDSLRVSASVVQTL